MVNLTKLIDMDYWNTLVFKTEIKQTTISFHKEKNVKFKIFIFFSIYI